MGKALGVAKASTGVGTVGKAGVGGLVGAAVGSVAEQTIDSGGVPTADLDTTSRAAFVGMAAGPIASVGLDKGAAPFGSLLGTAFSKHSKELGKELLASATDEAVDAIIDAVDRDDSAEGPDSVDDKIPDEE